MSISATNMGGHGVIPGNPRTNIHPLNIITVAILMIPIGQQKEN